MTAEGAKNPAYVLLRATFSTAALALTIVDVSKEDKMKSPRKNDSLGDHLPFWLSAISGATIAVYGNQILVLISAFIVFTERGLRNVPIIGEQFNPILVVYGGISALIEAVVMIVLAIYVIKRNALTTTIVLWALPIFTVHSIVFLGITDQLGWGIVKSITISSILWLAFMYVTRAINKSKRGRLNKGDASQ